MPFEARNRAERRAIARYAQVEAAKRPERLTTIPREQWPNYSQQDLQAVWQSRKFLVQVFSAKPFNGIECKRLTVCRVTLGADGRWDQNITWDELYAIKAELGFGDWYSIEIYPRERDLVNVANMRHLWLLAQPLQIGWFK